MGQRISLTYLTHAPAQGLGRARPAPRAGQISRACRAWISLLGLQYLGFHQSLICALLCVTTIPMGPILGPIHHIVGGVGI